MSGRGRLAAGLFRVPQGGEVGAEAGGDNRGGGGCAAAAIIDVAAEVREYGGGAIRLQQEERLPQLVGVLEPDGPGGSGAVGRGRGLEHRPEQLGRLVRRLLVPLEHGQRPGNVGLFLAPQTRLVGIVPCIPHAAQQRPRRRGGEGRVDLTSLLGEVETGLDPEEYGQLPSAEWSCVVVVGSLRSILLLFEQPESFPIHGPQQRIIVHSAVTERHGELDQLGWSKVAIERAVFLHNVAAYRLGDPHQPLAESEVVALEHSQGPGYLGEIPGEGRRPVAAAPAPALAILRLIDADGIDIEPARHLLT
mmetsp:Transcript_25526/g.75211  ORF Transcript_25526/g.75211 Transcript_25526/m.75211 type:complete len:306 (-) Transcript_25526:666-1583(-)